LVAAFAVGLGQWLASVQSAGALAFTPRVVDETQGIKDVAGRDINRDSQVDIVTVGDSGVKIYAKTGDWEWSAHVVDDKPAERVLVADLDRDDDWDLVVSLRGDSPSVRWYENRGDFEFASHALATAGGDADMGVGDLNADSYPDIVTVSGAETKTLERWMNNGDANFTSVTLTAASNATALVVGDITKDGYADIVTGGPAGLQRWSTSDGVTWARIDIDDSNENRSHLVIADTSSGSNGIVTADTTDDEMMLYRSSGGGQFGKKVIDEAADTATVAAADLDGDGDLDLLAAAQDNNEVYWYENDGLDIFRKHTLATNLQGVLGVATADFDSDGDLDVVTADYVRGTLYVYERLRKKPTATAPGSIQQGSNGAGLVTFSTTLADDDGEPTRARIQYSIDGQHWYKPWLTKAVLESGTADLENKRAYQVGSKNRIDTDDSDTVKVTLTWDTKSAENTGGPIKGDVGSVQLRVIPRDDRDIGVAAVSSKFRVDNAAPTGLTLKLNDVGETEAELSWSKPADSSAFSYQLYYGTNNAAVLARESDQWKGEEDALLTDLETTSTTITDLKPKTQYTFKLFVTDEFGNGAGAPSVQGKTASAPAPDPDVTPTPGFAEPSAAPSPSPSGAPATPTPAVSPVVVVPTIPPTPTPSKPSVLQANTAPIADAGPDQVVNSRALVILDGSASYDADPGDSASLTYNWWQIAGPTVDFLSDRTPTPSFSAGSENETYIFRLTTRDIQGATAIDTVTVATKALPESSPVAVEIDRDIPPGELPPASAPTFLDRVLLAVDLFLLALALLSTVILLVERLSHVLRGRGAAAAPARALPGSRESVRSRVVHYKTGEPIMNATVLIYGEDGKLRAQERTNTQGVFASFFPPGVYTLAVRVDGFAFAPGAAKSLAPADSIIYSGGKITVKDPNHPPSIIIPMKPTGTEVTSMRVRTLHIWQTVQYVGRLLSWPIFVAGAILNTVLVFWTPSLTYLVIEVIYIILVIIKIAVEIRLRPAYGLVRDAITHIPLELAVVRLLEQGSNRLVMTRVSNSQGKFFALPPAGTYTITISKPGYGTFTKEGVEIVSDHDTTLQMMADLMPVAPKTSLAGLARARAATI
jgi:hypothetical protein